MSSHPRPEHKPIGDPCKWCGHPHDWHRVRPVRERNGDTHVTPRHGDRHLPRKRPEHDARRRYIGIDGEGVTGKDKIHRYTMLAASTADGSESWVKECAPGARLTTEECLDLILELPTSRTKIFSFSFNYDMTKILTDLGDKELYLLFRPELRQRFVNKERGPWPISWCPEHGVLLNCCWKQYKLSLLGTKFGVRRGKKLVTIWDLFRFFGTKFTNVLTDWKITTPEVIERMTIMKDQRANFDKLSPEEVRDYCLEECRCMAKLAKELIDAHKSAGLKLRHYYGAGSSGAAMLTAMDIKGKGVNPPKEMERAVAAGFFGGRFENSVVGTMLDKVYSYDISSAYPYQLYFLPCLQHGKWEHTFIRSDIDNARTALVRYKLRERVEGIREEISDWAPFPFRGSDGGICYPSSSGGGWLWASEYLAGERFSPNHVQFEEAWVYHSDCDCRPFKKIAEYYIQRCMLGKESKGKVIKLGANSCYGKLAQSAGGGGLFNNWVWAGMITAGCRAQLLDLMSLNKDRASILMVATDGCYGLEDLGTVTPEPLETGTNLVINGKKKPLGGWEPTPHGQGVFIARPGIYFPINPTMKELKEVRARGVGKGVVLANWRQIMSAFEQYGVAKSFTIAKVSRFCGAKTSIHFSGKGFTRADGTQVTPGTGDKASYGQWVHRDIEMSFNPMPKRAGVAEDGKKLLLRKYSQSSESEPYGRAIGEDPKRTLEGLALKLGRMYAEEQPDCDVSDFDGDSVDVEET